MSLNANAAWLSSRFVSFPGAQCYASQTTRGCSASVRVFDAAGLRLPLSPKFTSTVRFNYDLPVSGDVVPFVQGDWYHRTAIDYDISKAPGDRFGTVDLFGASVGARISDSVRVAVFCKNCTDRHVPTSIGTDPGDASASPARLTYLQGFNLDSVRTIGFTTNFQF